MGFGRGVPLWALTFMICSIQQKVSGAESSETVTIIPPLTTTPVITSFNPAHNGRVCSTWGNFYYKTFDGDIYHFPGVCNYVFASHCNAPFEDFNIQIRHTSGENATHEIKTVSMNIAGMNIEMETDGISVNNERIQVPYSESGCSIERVGNYVIVHVKEGLDLMWNEKDSLMLELDEKYANQTCGLCGDFNGIQTYNEFLSNNAKITPLQFGNMQKMNGPTEDCADPTSSSLINCANVSTVCREILTGPAFSDCNNLVGVDEYIESCEQDLCFCDENTRFSCLCATFAEYSRQCAHAGGHPQSWRTSDLCPKTCPFNMQYQECGSPCADACTNSERSQLCEDHCLDGCFCPAGTVYDDINNSGCISMQECSCVYNGQTYAPGTTYSDHCRSCYCSGGQWSCTEMPCPGICSVEGGSHISTYDEKRYDVHGDCTYVLSKICDEETFTVLGELRKCGLTDTETCLKMVALSINGGLTTIVVKPGGAVFVNWIYTQLPISAANVTIFRPSSFFIIVQTNYGLQLEIQLTPIMQLFVRLDPSFKGKTCGLCGNFDSRQTDDFKAISGVVEGTAPAFANTWKTQAICPNIKQNFEDPCSLSIENEKYAHHWCGLLTDAEGPFAKCHPSLNPAIYHKNCMFDTCNCERSEDCMCASLSAYVRACAAKGVELPGWRTNVCSKYMTSCPKSLAYSYTISSCQPTCRSLSEPDITCNIKFVPVDGCTCINGTYMDDYGKCVPASSCPCYYRGTAILPGEVLHDTGVVCTCAQGKMNCIGALSVSMLVCTAPMVYFDCKNATTGSTGAECQKSCQTLDMQCYSTQCMSGCVCPSGLVSDGKGNCIAMEECPCIHNDATYNPGEKIKVDCNTCVCQNRMWKCTQNKCLGTCAVYGDGHFITFDDKRYNFNGKCEYTLIQDHCGQNSSNQGTFRIMTENIPCGSTGTTCSKSIKVFLENYELILSEEHSKVVTRGDGNGELPYRIRSMGIYLVIETVNGVILLWDKKTSIFIKISPDFKGQVCGLCGNYDGNGINDFTTRSQSVVGDVLEFGNSWKVSPTCPDAKCIKDPCSKNPYRKSWSQKQCSIITSQVFAACHSQVEPTKYYEACVTDACACDSGGDCECFCTAVAAYAQACSEFGVCISWRTPSICPMFCDYYNAERECDWHYKACGAPCMKTCRNPSGRCLHQLPGLEGCYPYCPADKPYFNEEEMKCVDQCGCYDAEDNYYPLGTHIDLRDTCQSCTCTSEGIMCNYDGQACYCHYEGKEYIYKQVIYNTTDGLGWCMTATCDVNGTIYRDAYKCVGLTTTEPPFTFTTIPSTSGAEPTTPATTACVHKVCEWSEWYDVSYPTFGENNGDYETPDDIRAKGHNLCKFPDEVECRAERFPNIKPEYLNQNIQCTKKGGLICNNKDQTPPMCYNYQIKFLCCIYTPCEMTSPTPIITSHGGTTPTAPHSTTSLVSESTICQPECSWTAWFDVSDPTSTKNTGDIETMEEIRKAGNQVCDSPQYIECRAEDYPDVDIALLGQTVQCDPKVGLLCRNADQKGKLTECLNYQVRFHCCDYSHCRPGTTPGATTTATSTKFATSTPGTTPGLTSSPPSSSMGSTPPPTLWTTTLGTTVVATSPGKETTTTLSTPLSTIQVTTPGFVSTPSVSSAGVSTSTATSLQSTPVSKPTGSVPTESTSPQVTTTSVITTTTLPPSGSTSPSATSTICQPECSWTAWMDVSQPESAPSSGDVETIEAIREAGKHVCDSPQYIECRAEDYPDVDIALLGQTVQCNPKVGLLCRNADQKGKLPMCLNYQARFHCCDYSRCRPGTTPGTTTTATSTKHATSTLGTTPGLTSSPPSSSTASTPPPILWTTTQGTTVVATSPGKETTTTLSTPLSTIQVTTPGSVSTPSLSSAGVSTSTATSLQSTPVSMPTGSVPTESTSPQVTTTSVITTTTLPASGSTSPSATSTICQPECSWTAWMDVSQPESAPSSGDVETIEAIQEAGKHVCDSPQYIECRAEDYPDVDIALLGQTVQCDPKVGLLCRNADQKGKLPMCLNYQARFHCCDYSHCQPGTTPGATTTATSTKHATSMPGTTPGLTSSPPSSSTASTPPPILWTTTQGTTILATSPGKETTTTLSTPLSTIQVTTPGSVSTPSVSSAGVSTLTATSLQSTPVSKPTGSVPTESTSPQVTTTSVITTTTLPPSGSTSPSATSTICQPECSWTAWMDVSQPESAPSSGDVETIEAIREAGKHVCDSPQYIECRAEDYPDVDIALLGQTVQCNPKVGLLCRNADQKGKLPMCLNYQARFHCCDYSRCRPGTTPGTTTTATSTKHATSTLGTTPGLTSSPPSSSTASTPPPILWTTTQGTTVVATSPGKETTTTLSTPLSTIQVTTPGSVSTPSLSSAGVSTSTATSLQSTPVSKPTGSVPTESTSPQVTTTSVITTTTLPASGSTSPSATSTICQPECSWTAWMDVSQPESAPSSGDVETIEAIQEAGKHVCDSPQYIECRAEDYPDVDIALLGQTVQCDPKVGLLCRNADQKGKLPMCLNYQARFHCCDYSHCQPGTTPGATTTATSTKHATSMPGTTPGLTRSPPSSSTASTPPPILWTTTQGTTILATSPGKETTTTLSTPLSTIQVTTPGSVSTPSVSSAGVSTLTATSLQSTPVSKPTGSVPTESTSPQVTTTSVITTTTLPPSGSTSPSATSTICQPECSWTAWMDVSQPESAPSSGDVETIEAIREAGKHVCDSPQYIECRAEDYPDVDIALLGQTVQCDPKVGLLCRNADQKGKLPMCLNYQARFHCCDYSRCRPGTTPGATTTATSTKHATRTPGTTPGLTSSPPSSSTASTPPPILWTTTQGTTVLATSPGKETTTTLSTPLSTIQVTTPGSVSTPSVSSAGVSTSTATSLQSTPVSKPTGSVPTESTSPQVTTTSVITTTTLPPSGSTSPSATSTICQPECSWTAWMDVSQPESAPSSGDVETIEAIREAGKHVCDSPQYIECRAEDYPDVDIALLGQTVQCDPKVGLLCRNADQKGKLPMCLNYQARFHCCDYSRCRPGTTPGATTTATSTKHATRAPGTTPGLTSSPPSSSTASTPPPILWTTTRGTTVVATSPGKETTTTLSTPLSTIQVTTLGSVSTPSVSSAGVSTSTATSLQSTPVSKPTGSVPTESTSPQVTTTSIITTTTLPPSGSTSPSATSTICQPECSWTAWMDVSQPESTPSSGDVETIETIREAGKHVCDSPQYIECRAEDYPDVDIALLGQTVQCDPKVGLLCRNADQKGKLPMCLNYQARFHCCDYSRCRPGTTPGATTTATSTKHATSTPGTTPGLTSSPPSSSTASTPPPILWTTTQGTTVLATSPGKETTTTLSTPLSTIQVTTPGSVSTPSVSSAGVSTSTATSLQSTPISKPTGSVPTESTSPQVTTTSVITTTTLPPSGSTSPSATSTICQPECSWTAWMDVSQPESAPSSGDVETIEAIREAGKHVCDSPQYIECRAEDYPDVDIALLGQTVQCDPKVGLLCRNADQKGKLPMCLNYQARFHCCDYSRCRPGTTPGATTTATSTKHATSTLGTTPGLTSSPPSSSTASTPPPILWTTTQGTTVVATSPGKETTTTLSTPLSTIQVTTPGSVSTPSVSSAGVSTSTATSLQSTPVSKPTGSVPTESTSPQVTTTSVITTTTLPPSGSTSPSATSTICQPECSWTAWMDVSQPESAPSSGDVETIEAIREAGKHVCDSPQYIECRAEDYPDVDIALLGQTVQCDPKVGLLCRNADQKGKLPMCLNYQARFHCCDYSRCRPGTTPGATTTATSTKHATSTPGTTPGLTSSPPSSSTASTPPPILWTTTQGTTVLATSPGKETTTTLSTPLSTIQVTIPGSVSTPSVSSAGVSTSTATSLQSTPVSKPTGSVPTESTSPQVTTTSVITTTTLPASGSTSPSATSTICQPECSWTAWMDVSQPESAPSSGDVETIEAIREAGKHVCDSPQYIECRAEDYPDVDIALLGQTVQCDPKVGLLCRNADQKGKLPMCLNYQARFHCCDYSRCRPGTTPGATTTATSTKHATSTLGTTPGLTSSPPSSSTASTPPPILWTTTQGTTVVATSPGKETTTTLSTPLSTIQVTTPGSVSTPSVSSAGVSTSTATSLQSTPVSKPTGSVPTESTSPQVTTTSVITTTTLPPSGSTSPSATSTICQPECSWTAWMDVSQPESAPSSGDVETIEAIREAGKHVCDSPQYIECRAEDYPDVDIALLGQTVQCDPKVGLLCRNADQKGKLPMCLNYQARFHCCDYSRCRPGTTPGATTTATSTKHATRTPGTTPGLTSSPPSSSTASTPPPILWTTTQGTTVLATSPGKETTTTLSTPLSTIQVTTPGSVSTPSVSSAGISTSTATSLQSTPVSKPTGSVPTESTSPQVTTTSVITTTTLPPSGSTSPSATSTICQPECSWTAWMDVSQPESAPSSGDVETIEAIREAGKHVCDSPQYIECRAEDYPDVDIALLGQTVQCDPKVGLLCRNADQKGKLPMCLNYQARFHCCDYSRCRPGTTPGATTTATSTKHATSTPGTTPGLTSSPPSSSTASTPPPILWTTTRGTTVLATSPGKESTTTLSTPLSTIQVTTPGSVSTPSVSSAGVSTSTATSLQSTPVSKPTGSVPTESTSPEVTTTSVITTTTLPASGSTSPSATSTICQPECSWTAWMDVSQPESAPSSGDVETIEAIREAGKHVCDSPQYIECRAEDYPDVDIALLGQTVQCDPKVGLLCRNADQKGKLPMCLNYQARFHCCDYSRCRPGTTPGATTTATSTKHATSTPGTTPGLTSSPPSSSTASTPPPILWTTTRGTTVVATSPGKETTTTLSTPLSTIQVTTPGSVSTPSVSSAGVSTSTATTLQSTPVSKPTGSVPTESTSPQVTTTSVITTTTLPPSGSTSPLVSEPTSTKHATSTPGTTPGLTSSPPSSSTGSTPPPTLWTTTQGTTVVATSPGKETTTTLSTPLSTTHVPTPGSISTPSVSSATVSSSPATSLQSTSVSKPTGSVPTKRTTLEVSSTPFGQHTSPLPLVSTSVGVTETSPSLSSAYTSIASTTKIVTTSSTGHISVTSSGVTPCFCHVSGVSGGLFSPGEVIYNRTDSSGCSFYAICDKNCEVKRSQGPCSSTTPSHPTTPSVTTVGMSSLPSASTPTILIPSTVIRTSSAPSTAPVIIPTTPVQGCPNADPPRKTNETWMYNNCSVATCEGNNRIVVVLPPPVEKITCENKLPPVKIDHDDGCTYHYDCTCVCSGWDNSHFETFDGTSYIFHDNCTYILVQEIVNKYGNFSVLVDNYFCDPANNQSCSRSIIVNYNHMEVILSSQIYDGIRTNKVIFNKETIRTSFSKDGIIVADSGTSMSVEIPDIHAFINFNGFTFSIQVPFDLFAFNTEGQCGTCSNDRSDDCRLPSGHEASSCSEMAPHWKVNDSCKIVIPTPEPTGATTTPSEVTCATPSPLCELIVSDIFSDCHKVLPPKVFYDRCLSEACQNASGALTCYSVEMYASLCKDKGFCSDWRSKTQGKCPYHCPEGKVYEACGPVYPATCDKGKANITEHVTEGCFCPENQILVNSYTDTCVQDCKFCIGPEGFPKMPGTTWRSNCQECICDQLSVTVQCTAQPCSTPSTPPCEKEGFMPVSVLTPEDPCCPEIQCICNASACSNRKRSCEAGYQLTSVLFEGDCCVSFLCEPIPDICVVNETVYSPGGSIPSDSCETCVCSHETDPGSKRNLVECEPIQCDTECSVGYEYQVTAGECCGKCVQVTCTININGTTQVLKPGDIWQPESNNCSHYECEKEDDQLILVSSRRTCPIIDPNECGDNETEMTPDGCCKMCKPKTNCKVQTNQILVRQNDCVSSELVELTYCEGACPSSSMYSAKARAMQHKCTCCQELKSHKKEVSLTCRDGTTINYDYIYVDECQCMTACIPEATTAD
uniref:mucin-5B-like n=1 Tax=Euleptes europaea TaxID=460621 RepID=UPI00253FF6F1|nr:mucin-5B-like [Euleptes europaea]